jgi:peptidyl-prolyl cis-trans isomerase B (cyclophilin B)
MKRKILSIVFMLMSLFCITACGKEKENNVNVNKSEEFKFKQDLNVIKEEEGEIMEGTLEGYTFKVTDKETDRVKIEMEDGSIMLVVLSNKDTPITIKNFKKLVSQGFYDGIIFHRVIKDFMIQGGDPTGTGYEGSDEKIKGEFNSNGVKNSLSHTRGVISMARGGNDMNSASSQFFIVHKDSTYLDGDYASFGKVFAGLDVVDKIAGVDTDSNDKPLKNQTIKTIKFITIEKAE